MNELLRTPLADLHVRLGAKMIPFAGFEMPIQYSSMTAEHRAVRENAGLFDVSHMGEFVLTGPAAGAALQGVTVNDVAALAVDQAQYSAMVNEDGGILDDCVVYRLAEERFMVVVNAANVEKDWSHIQAHLPAAGVVMTNESRSTALIALQGPGAEAVLEPLVDVDLGSIRFYWKRDGTVAGVPAIVSRTGYTGEDGFELYMSAGRAGEVWNALMEAGKSSGLTPCGLGARDTLRLEMRYALYGNDIDETTNPYEAGLGWIVKLDKGEFIGRSRLLKVHEAGVERRLAGFRLLERGVPRPGYPIVAGGEIIAEVRSGAMSPTLGYGIGTGILPVEHAKPGSAIAVRIRDREIPAEVVEPPFYEGGSLKH